MTQINQLKEIKQLKDKTNLFFSLLRHLRYDLLASLPEMACLLPGMLQLINSPLFYT